MDIKIYLEILLTIEIDVGLAYCHAGYGVAEGGIGCAVGAGGGGDGVEDACAALQRNDVRLIGLADDEGVADAGFAAFRREAEYQGVGLAAVAHWQADRSLIGCPVEYHGVAHGNGEGVADDQTAVVGGIVESADEPHRVVEGTVVGVAAWHCQGHQPNADDISDEIFHL